jgi:very-short-patch-repair endonuclease
VIALAAHQQGMVSTPQLAAAGFDDAAIAAMVVGGWLARVLRGVYRVGPFAGPYGDEMAALLACGPRSALSHRTSLHMWGIRERVGPVEVIVPGGRATAGVKWRRAPLPPGDVVERFGMRVTTPARTLADVAGSTTQRDLARLVEEARRLHLVTSGELLAVAARSRGRAGVGRLRAILLSAEEPSFTRSEAERLLLELVRNAGLPGPQTNVNIAGYEVDFLWPDQKLVVEVDGYAFHGTREAFERDRARDAALLAAGLRVLRVTWRRITKEPHRLLATISSALAPITEGQVRKDPGQRAPSRVRRTRLRSTPPP